MRYSSCRSVKMSPRVARNEHILWRAQDPDAFCAAAEAEQAALREKLTAAAARARDTQVDRTLKIAISEICALLDVDGIRGDITTNKAARALAAYEGETVVTLDHIRRVIGLCLNHRCAAAFPLPLPPASCPAPAQRTLSACHAWPSVPPKLGRGGPLFPTAPFIETLLLLMLCSLSASVSCSRGRRVEMTDWIEAYML